METQLSDSGKIAGLQTGSGSETLYPRNDSGSGLSGAASVSTRVETHGVTLPASEIHPVSKEGSLDGAKNDPETENLHKSLLSMSGANNSEKSVSVVPDSPDGYEFSYSKEIQIDPALEGSFKEFAHQNGINTEVAQKLVDFNCESIMRQQAQLTEQIKGWCDEVKKMPGWQGNSFNEKISVAHGAVGRFVPPEVAELLDSTGYGNHPAVVKMFYEIGKNMSEDRYVDAQHTAAKRDPASILYPNQGKY